MATDPLPGGEGGGGEPRDAVRLPRGPGEASPEHVGPLGGAEAPLRAGPLRRQVAALVGELGELRNAAGEHGGRGPEEAGRTPQAHAPECVDPLAVGRAEGEEGAQPALTCGAESRRQHAVEAARGGGRGSGRGGRRRSALGGRRGGQDGGARVQQAAAAELQAAAREGAAAGRPRQTDRVP